MEEECVIEAREDDGRNLDNGDLDGGRDGMQGILDVAMGGDVPEVLASCEQEILEGAIDNGKGGGLADAGGSCGGLGMEENGELRVEKVLDGSGEGAQSRKRVLDWKKTVISGHSQVDGVAAAKDRWKGKEKIVMSGNDHVHGAGNGLLREGEGVKGLSSSTEGASGAHVWTGKHCRELVFSDKEETFVEDDGCTMRLNVRFN